MAAVTPVALDHNFPEPLLRDVAIWLPEFAFHWIKDLPPDDLNELEDHDLIYELHRRAFPLMVTNNHKMLDDRWVLVGIEQARLTVVAIEGAGDDPVFATGVLLRDLPAWPRLPRAVTPEMEAGPHDPAPPAGPRRSSVSNSRSSSSSVNRSSGPRGARPTYGSS